MTIQVNSGKVFDGIFLRLDFNIYNKNKSRFRIFLDIENTQNMISFIKLSKINTFKCYDDFYKFDYTVEIHADSIKEYYEDEIASQYTCDKKLYTIAIMGNMRLSTIAWHQAIVLDLIPTFKCNMNCDYCFQHKFHGDSIAECTDIKDMYTDIASYLKGMEFKQINLFGGELSIDLDRCELADKVADKYFKTNYTNRKKIFTNAKEYNPEFSRFIKQDSMKNLYFSISSLSEKIYDPRHVDIPTTLSNINKYINDLGEDKIKAVIIADELTLDYLEETVYKLKSVGVRRFIIKLENRLNGQLFYKDEYKVIDKYRSIIEKLTNDPTIMIYVRNDYSPSMYLCFLLNREDNENRSVCEMCLCTVNDGTSLVHLGVEDMVYTKNLRLYSIINGGNVI